MQLFVGTSGYSYSKWKGSFYPAKLPQSQMLSYYAERFGAVEINNTFYKMPNPSDVRSWAAEVPKNFRFAIKGATDDYAFQATERCRRTNEAALWRRRRAKGAAWSGAFRSAAEFQRMLPGSSAFEAVRSRQAAFEFRHASWFDEETFDCLRERRCARFASRMRRTFLVNA